MAGMCSVSAYWHLEIDAEHAREVLTTQMFESEYIDQIFGSALIEAAFPWLCAAIMAAGGKYLFRTAFLASDCRSYT